MITIEQSPDLLKETYDAITINPNSQYVLDRVILSLIEIKNTPNIFKKVTDILYDHANKNKKSSVGRTRMPIYTAFCLYIFRKTLDLTYDALTNYVENHIAIRRLLGINNNDEIIESDSITPGYSKTAIKENLSLITSDVVDQINLILLKFGQNKITYYKVDEIKAKTDSSVVQTNIEFPVDTGLLYDSMQVLFRMMAQLSILVGCKSFRQSKKILKKLKKLIRSLHCTKKVELKKSIAKDIVALANKYANEVKVIIDSITIENNEKVEEVKSKFKTFIDYVFKFADQIERRIIKGEQIPHSEKVFSIFKPHTEWISKGKSGIICELGIKVLITTDQYNFIIGHEVMQNKSDVDVILDHIKKLLENQHITFLSCDKGFHSKRNQEELSKLVTNVVIPQKGKLSKERKDKEHEDIFIDTRKDHAEIESNINGLGSMGYAKCRDVSLEKFKTHVSVTVLARNLWNIGRFLIKKLKKSS